MWYKVILEFLKKIFTKERIIWAVLLVAAVLAAWFAFANYNKYEAKYNDAVTNNKAYQMQLDKEKAQSNVFKLTVDQLNYYNDSITTKLNDMRKELNIKDNQLAQMSYLSSEIAKKDTLVLTDTIFCEPEFVFDTVIGDKWVNTQLHLEYPSTITVNPTVHSEKGVIWSNVRETVDPPKKFFLCRWFQKKHTVVKVNVKENNPHVVEQENLFIEIIK